MMLQRVARLGGDALYWLEHMGLMTSFLGAALLRACLPPYDLYPIVRQIHFIGARSVTGLGCPFLFEGLGLIIAVSSYCDDFLFQFGSSPEMMPDPEFFRDCIQQAFEELAAAG